MTDLPFKDVTITVFWFRRDLRIGDNHGLYRALLENINVLPVFIFDNNILKGIENKSDSRVNFIYQQIIILKKKFERAGSSLLVLEGNPLYVFEMLIKRFNISAVYANHDYEPYSIKRDAEVRELLLNSNILFNTFKDHVIFEKDEVVNNNNKPYKVYTPYSKKWKLLLNNVLNNKYPGEQLNDKLIKNVHFNLPTLNDIGFEKSNQPYPEIWVDDEVIRHYALNRDFPGVQGTTRLGLHLRYGTVSIRELVSKAVTLSEVFLNELIWREFYIMVLANFPHIVTKSFKTQYESIEWINDNNQFEAWKKGMTGYPIVDAGMRELNETGFMHNRVRMITASFLTRQLLIDWRYGEAYFAEKLLDYELASNNGNWQWAAGSGCDAVPYFRMFNPSTQALKYDCDNKYIRKWINEFDTKEYPLPVIDYGYARERYLKMMGNIFRKK